MNKRDEESLVSIKVHLEAVLFDANAVALCLDLYRLCQIWDDWYDGDISSKDDILQSFRIALFEIPTNPFFDAFRKTLTPLLLSVLQQWEVANQMEDGKESPEKSYMLRAGVYQIFHMCLFLAHGDEHAKKHGKDVYSIYGEDVVGFLRSEDDA